MIASGYQIVVRQKADRRPSLVDLCHKVFPVGFPPTKTLTEIIGHSGTGKTLLLRYIITKAVIPKEIANKSCKVIYIDANHKRSVGNFKYCVRDMLADSGYGIAALQDNGVLTNSLKCVIYLPCYSAEQLDLALAGVEDLLWEHEDVALLAIDGLDAFYWEDCYSHLVRKSTHYKNLCQRIKPICQEHNICCICTLDTNYLLAKSTGTSNIINPWVDYKLHLQVDANGERYMNDKTFWIVDGVFKFSK